MRSFNHLPTSLWEIFDANFDQQASQNANISPFVEIIERDDTFLLAIDLPGINKEDIKLEVKDGYIHVSAQREKELKENDYSEIRYGSYKRKIKLPKNVLVDDIKAQFLNGVLNLTLQKEQEKIPQKIEISS
jgi:HSP20 family protein